MPSLPALPSGYHARPSTVADVAAIHELVAACERELHGHATTDRDGIASVFKRDGLDPARDTLSVYDAADRLVARAWVDRRSEADVHPDHRGRGLGGLLLAWMEARAREVGTERIVQTIADVDESAAALLSARGYTPMVSSWQLEIAIPGPLSLPEPPIGVEVRPFRAGDEPSAHRVTEDAFTWQGRTRPYAEWAAHTVERASFSPDASVVATVDDEMVGVVLCLDDPRLDDGYVEQVAVRSDHRNKGIARSLLRHAFHAFHRRGRRSCVLWTHSETGALSLYRKVGMTIRQSSTVYGKGL